MSRVYSYRRGVFSQRCEGGVEPGGWTEDEALAFAKRVEEIADEERARAAIALAETLPPGEAS